MYKSTFKITKMDCPSEEHLIRMKLGPEKQVQRLEFDIPNRKLCVFHTDESGPILKSIHQLGLNETLLDTTPVEAADFQADKQERELLWWVLGINFSFFIIEMVAGLFSESMGLVADSLDMLADAIVYGLSLMAVGASVTRKKNVARLSGYFQMGLALLGLAEVIRRFFGYGDVPEFQTMVVVAGLALMANIMSLYLIQKNKSQEAHMRASSIFTSNDIIVNAGVIVAGLLVYWTTSRIPDLVIGSIIFLVVMRGAVKILKLSKA